MISALDAVALFGAGMLAGLVGSAGGITSLISYPALLAVGLGPLAASIANNVALVACWPGSALASQPELKGRGAWIRRHGPLAAVGGGAGAALLLLTPAGAFAHIVPFLVLAGSLALAFEPRLTAWRQRRSEDGEAGALAVGIFALSVYNGYFGAGSGVMILTLMLVLVDTQLPRANALKNMLVGAGTILAAVVFIIVGPVHWAAVAPLAGGMLIGASLGPRAARRLPARLLRYLVVALGLALAVQLWVDPHL